MFFAVKLEKLTPSCAAWSKQAHMSRMGEHDAQEGLKKMDARQLVSDNSTKYIFAKAKTDKILIF